MSLKGKLFYSAQSQCGNTCALSSQNTVDSLLTDTSIYKKDTSVKRTPRVGPYLSLLPLFDSLYDRHLSKTDT